MGKHRVLIVDDAAIVRTIVTDVLSADPELEIVGAAENGRVALKQIHLLDPDIIILDVEMPEMDGFEALKAIKVANPDLPVIMFSTLFGNDSTNTEAFVGAAACIRKPTNLHTRGAAREHLQETLIASIKAVFANG